MRGPLVSAVVGGVMLAAIGFSHRVRSDAGDVQAYHETIGEAAEHFPVDFGPWRGFEVELPPSATKLLRPNALVAREYRTDVRGGLSATLLLVQCEDIRDMQGHYPPNCYPAHGWAEGEMDGRAEFGPLTTAKYEFVRSAGGAEGGITVYNFFVMPTGDVTVSMDDVRRASADYLMRPYGAAQIQVVINSSVPRSEHGWVLEQMHEIAAPVLETLLAGAPAHRTGDIR
jgi:hypothetical protein